MPLRGIDNLEIIDRSISTLYHNLTPQFIKKFGGKIVTRYAIGEIHDGSRSFQDRWLQYFRTVYKSDPAKRWR